MPKNKILSGTFTKLRAFALLIAVAGIAGGSAIVHADQYEAQIRALDAQNQNTRSLVNGLQSEASSYQDAINKLQAQINGIQAALAANQAKQAEVQRQITENQVKIDQQKAYLSESIKVMYIDGQLSSIEQLASSRTLSDYIDKEEYRTSVQNKIDLMIKEIAALQLQLQGQKQELDVLIASQKQQNDQLAAAQAQQQQMLAYNESQQSAYNSQISANNSKIAELRRQQVIANSRFLGGTRGTGTPCGGGYPYKWCSIPIDSVIDDWGMYNRECVSYTAFRVAASGRYMPYWGGYGNANQWDDNARRMGIPVDTNPRVGDVAVSNAGYYGHVMYVEGVNGDGTINISQYNAGFDGLYSVRYNLPIGNLVFIHF